MPQCSSYQCVRPLKLAIFGTKGVGKTSLALQYLTEQHIDPTPTTIEDIYRKSVDLSILSQETAKIFFSKWRRDSDEKKRKRSVAGLNDGAKNPDSARLKFSLEITDTAGYCSTVPEKQPRTSFLQRMVLPPRTRYRMRRENSDRRKRYSSSASVGSLSLMARHDACLRDCDGLILVFNVLDSSSLAAIQEIRNRFVRLHTGDDSGRKSSLLGNCCRRSPNNVVGANGAAVPPIFVVGTHTDERNLQMPHEKPSRLYNVNFSRDRTMLNARRKEKQVGSGSNGDAPHIVFPHDVYEIINGWVECAGFAEVAACDHAMVRQIFEQLSLAIVTSLPLSTWEELHPSASEQP